ncbi:MAG TPA: Smr/MutS family protein [Gemmatimonadales bacterium]
MSDDTRTPPAFRAPASPETLIQLEFPRALDEVAGRAVGPLGAAAVRRRVPSPDRDAVRQDLATVTELQGLLAAGDPFRPEPIEDVTPILAAVRVPGAVLDPADLVALGRAFEAMRIVRVELHRVEDRAPRTAALGVPTPPPGLGRELLETFEPDGRVGDGVDAGVDRARRNVRDARSRLLQSLERTLRGLAAHEASPDAAVTVRSGRYVIPVHADARGRVPGIVHAESASGATLFVEPQDAVELGNQLAAAGADESRAVHAVLRGLSEAVRPHVDAANDGLAMCVAADDLYARARYAADVDGHAPRLGPPGDVHVLRRCRHPLLLAEGVEAVPFDLELTPDELALIVSGPNTGGKTVLLKAVGLVNALVQAGVVPPLGERSELPAYATIVTDIGDHQSIAANLSTFSAHVAALRRALDRAGPGTLVLLDEIGSGTDPAEGAALAAAVLQELVARGARTVATTHLGALKQLAAETPGVVNASLHFDAASLTPTYELAKGIPGRSYGLVIARRLGIPADVVAAAEARRPEVERTLETVLADVERRTADLAAREAAVANRETDAEMREARAARLQTDIEIRDAEVRERQTTLEREGREQARRFLLEARKRVDEALGVARAAVSEATAREARRLVEQGISEEATEIQRLEEALARKGWRVRGTVDPDTATLAPSRPSRESRNALDSTSPSPTTEVDLRGMTGDEARDAVIRAVDDAVLADLPAVRIIHGKGTGVLRRVVDEVLRADRRVTGRRLAPPREGGTGVTIAELAG